MNDVSDAWFGGRARRVRLERLRDARGELMPLPFDRLPFVPRRVFVVRDVPRGTVRGGHGHRSGQQLLVCLHGEIRARLQAGGEAVDLVLAADADGLLVGPGVWCAQTYAAPDSVLLVLASDPYDPSSYLAAPEDAR